MAVYHDILVEELAALLEQSPGLHLIDVRESDEYAQIRALGSRSLPLSALSLNSVGTLGLDKDQAVYLICRSGRRSARACEVFAAAGFKQVFNVDGGMIAWEAADLPLA